MKVELCSTNKHMDTYNKEWMTPCGFEDAQYQTLTQLQNDLVDVFIDNGIDLNTHTFKTCQDWLIVQNLGDVDDVQLYRLVKGDENID